MNTFQEQKQKIIDTGYKYVILTKDGVKKISQNGPNKIIEHLDKIEKVIANCDPGQYKLEAKFVQKEPYQEFPFFVGTQQQLAEQKPQIIFEKPIVSDKLLENQKILEITVALKQLEMENKYLKEQILDLESEITDLEAAAAVTLSEQTPVPNLLESAKDFLGNLMEFGAPLLDQHFSLKKQQLEIERMKLAGRRQNPGTQQKPDVNVQIRKIGEFVETYKDQPEIYEVLHNISAQSTSVHEFMSMLNNYNTELHAELSNEI